MNSSPWALAISLISLVLSFSSLVISALQWRSAAKSVEASNLLRLVLDVLGKDEEIKARKCVARIGNKPLHEWSPEERDCGERVIRTYDFLGLMTKRGLLDEGLVLSVWGRRVLELWNCLHGLRDEIRPAGDDTYMGNFRWLAKEAEKLDEKYRLPSRKH
jgi:hypothetical protein